jgi:GDP-L-fucose synthase
MIHYDPLETAAHRPLEADQEWSGNGPPRSRFWSGKRVLVTGGSGFLGSHLLPRLRALGCEGILAPRSHEYDLTEQAAVRDLFRSARPDLVIHLAAQVGGIGANRENPGRYFYDNLMMGALLVEEARRSRVRKFVQLGTICAYPKFTPVPFREEDLWEGYPEETNAPYGIAKKALLVQLQAYRQQYGFNGIYLLPVNLYGPSDNFDLRSSHVVPALIRKMVEAVDQGLEEVMLWGTGEASREFLYVEDAARGILLAAEHYEGSEPVNLGSGVEIRIRELAVLIAELTGFAGRIAYDPSLPDGQPRRVLDTRKAQRYFGFQARTKLREGLAATIAWYRARATSQAEIPALAAHESLRGPVVSAAAL